MLRRRQYRKEKKTNKQIRAYETDVAWLIILATMNVKLYGWMSSFRKVVRQRMWEVLVVIKASSIYPSWN